MYVLILIGWLYGNAHGPIITSVEMTTADHCETAKRLFVASVKEWGMSSGDYAAFCVEK